MIQRKITTMQPVTTTVEYPDFYTYDETPRGAAVDALLTARGYRPRQVREGIFHDERIQGSISLLQDSYRDVDAVLSAAS